MDRWNPRPTCFVVLKCQVWVLKSKCLMIINHVESPCLSMFHGEILILHRLKPLTNQVWVPASLFGASADWAPLSPSWTSAACYMVSLGGPKALFDIMVIGCHWVCLKMRHPAITLMIDHWSLVFVYFQTNPFGSQVGFGVVWMYSGQPQDLIIFQWPFQEPKLEVPTICKGYIRPM